MPTPRYAFLVALGALALGAAPAAPAQTPDETALAERYAPVVRLVEQEEECGPGVILAGPLVGALLILLTSWPLWALNVVAGIVYAVTMPFVALTTAYLYFDARTRDELEPVHDPGELPAEVELAG